MEMRPSYADVDWTEITRILLEVRDRSTDTDEYRALNLAIEAVNSPSILSDKKE